MSMTMTELLVRASFLIAALLFILGIKRMASPLKARSGIQWAGVGMLLATFASFFYQDENGEGLHNMPWILSALALSVTAAWISGKKVAMTDMPQMVALYNGMGGGSAAAIGLVELLKFSAGPQGVSKAALIFAVIGSRIDVLFFQASNILIYWYF
jgi:NAD(P) transhydrogenase subunit beta